MNFATCVGVGVAKFNTFTANKNSLEDERSSEDAQSPGDV
jgi:hypothetical protein